MSCCSHRLARRTPYFAETGFLGERDANVALPTNDTVWTAEGKRLTPSTPVTLTWDNGQGLVFHRKISVDDNYMFTVRDSVENKGTAPVTLYSLCADFALRHAESLGLCGSVRRHARRDRRRRRAGDQLCADREGAQRNTNLERDWRLDRLYRQILGGDAHPRSEGADRGTSSRNTERPVKTYQTDVLYNARHDRAGREHGSDRPGSLPVPR